MKKITKIAASLMALAVTATSMSSIPASAAYTQKNFSAGSFPMLASVTFIPRQSYTARSRSFYTINHKEVLAYAKLTNGQMTDWFSGYSDTVEDDAVVTILGGVDTNGLISIFYSQEVGSRVRYINGKLYEDNQGRTLLDIH